MSVRKWPVIAALLAGLWLLVRGVTLDPARLAGEFLLGLAVGAPIAYGLRTFYTPRTRLVRNLRAVPYAVLYGVVFFRELLTANVDVAYRVLAPSMPIDPDVVAVPLRVESDAAVTTIANSITLTPGTLTMDYDAATNTLYVHGITGRDREAVLAPIRTWEDYALVIFDEAADPGDPVPPRRGGGDGAPRSAGGSGEPRPPAGAADEARPERDGPDGAGAAPGDPTGADDGNDDPHGVGGADDPDRGAGDGRGGDRGGR